jgi:hypothetical protein
MTKADALALFRDQVLPVVKYQYGKGDRVAIREAWNNYTDALCKEGQITMRQYETWVGPFR